MINIPGRLEKLLNGAAVSNDMVHRLALHVHYIMIPDSRLELSSDAANGSNIARPDSSFNYYHVYGITFFEPYLQLLFLFLTMIHNFSYFIFLTYLYLTLVIYPSRQTQPPSPV